MNNLVLLVVNGLLRINGMAESNFLGFIFSSHINEDHKEVWRRFKVARISTGCSKNNFSEFAGLINFDRMVS